jgi:glutaminyl-peptide cyclotransferase
MRRRMLLSLVFVLLAVGGVIVAVTVNAPARTPTPAPTWDGTVRELVPQIVNVYAHDANAFTQGLVWYDGVLYESAGEYGVSSLREVEIATGLVPRLQRVPPQYFAEGLALVEDRLIQITWLENTALIYNRTTFEQIGTFEYEGEGWGLCYDGALLYMSDGSDTLTLRDPQTFAMMGQIRVRMGTQPMAQLNELECVGDVIYANVWQQDVILQIDKASGQVRARITADALLTPEERGPLSSRAVLNGIAYNPTSDTFYLTGKLWPKLFEVRFVPTTAAVPADMPSNTPLG